MILSVVLAFAMAPRAVAVDTFNHLDQARKLVESLRDSPSNVYGGGKRHIDWDANPCTARTVCSSFLTLLLQRSQNWPDQYIHTWMGRTNPMAADYYDAITTHNGFLQIVHVGKIRSGDILAVRYTDHHVSRNGVEDTGHIMVVDQPLDMPSSAPEMPGLTQHFFAVIDSSASGHGISDTRHQGKGKFTGGIGRGIFRIYSDSSDHIAGYTWSDEKKSEFFSAPERILVAGRLDEERLPKP